MPCSPHDAGAVVAKNHVLAPSVHTTQTRPGGTPSVYYLRRPPWGMLHPGPVAQPINSPMGKYDKYWGLAVPRSRDDRPPSRRAAVEPVSAHVGAGAGRTGYLGLASRAAELQP